jgi:hypothetical protein
MQMRSALFWDIKQHIVVIPYGRFGATYRLHFEASRNPKIIFFEFIDPYEEELGWQQHPNEACNIPNLNKHK